MSLIVPDPKSLAMSDAGSVEVVPEIGVGQSDIAGRIDEQARVAPFSPAVMPLSVTTFATVSSRMEMPLLPVGCPFQEASRLLMVTLPLVAIISPSQPLSLISLLPEMEIDAGAKSGIAQIWQLSAGEVHAFGPVIVDARLESVMPPLPITVAPRPTSELLLESMPLTVMLPPAVMPVPLTQNIFVESSGTASFRDRW